jgi:hypothetical protein
MATGNRTLKLSILADVDELKKGLGEANKSVESSADKIADFGKKAALAFVAVGTAATAFAVQAVKNAAQDEAAQRKLEETIRASTKATEAQTKAVANYIDETSIAVGITDDELRPAFSRLVRSTNDVEEAQKLLNLALDITAATGKPLEAVTNALGKAYDGNLTSLSRLGLGIDQSILKTKDFDLVYQNLAGTFGNFAENEAQSTEAQFRRIQIAVDEAKESIGAALLPAVNQLTSFLLTSAVPALNQFIAGLTGSGLAADEAETSAFNFGESIRSAGIKIIEAKDTLIEIGKVIAFVFVTSKIYTYITALTALVAAFRAIQAAATAAGIAGAFATGGVNIAAGAVALAGAGIATGIANSAISGGNAASNMGASTATAAQLAAGAARAGTTVNNITVQSVDSEGAARAVAKVLNDSASRSVPQLYNSGITRAR